ncbi:hypothetical protein FRB98_003741, partial [Tulasnella sp. 332]
GRWNQRQGLDDEHAMETKITLHEVRLRRHPEPTPRWMANVDEDEMAMVKRGVDIVIRVMKRSAEEDDA